MPKTFMPELDHQERITILEHNADKVEDRRYFRILTPEELDQRRDLLTENAIKLSELEDEKKDAVSGFKSQMDPLIKQNKGLLTDIKTRQTEAEGKLYLMADHENGMMEVYDERGEMISSRRLYPEEKQGRMPFLKKVSE